MAFLRGLLLALSLVAPPGPVAVAQIQAGLAGGWRLSLAVGLGASVAVATYAAAGLAGGAALGRVPGARLALWAGGALLLAVYGALTLRSAAGAGPDIRVPAGGRAAAGATHPYALGFGLGALNPFSLVLLLALAAEPARTGGGRDWPFLGGLLVGVVGWSAALAAASEAGGRLFPPDAVRKIRYAAGVLLLVFAAGLALRGP